MTMRSKEELDNREPKKGETLKGTITAERKQIYSINTYVEPSFTYIFIQVLDKKDNSVPDAYVTWTASQGTIAKNSDTKTQEGGVASATFSSYSLGESVITARITKPGYKTMELSCKVEIIRNTVTLEILNSPAVGDIFLDGQNIGTGSARQAITSPGIHYVTWGNVDVYVTPEPAKLYINPSYSTAPMIVEGIYRKADENPDEIKLTVFVCITYDEQTGVPNTLPGAKVILGDGQEALADFSGRAVFTVKARSGPLSVKALHPEWWRFEHEITVNVDSKDLCVNCDLGIAFGGEQTIDVSFTEEELSKERTGTYDDSTGP